MGDSHCLVFHAGGDFMAQTTVTLKGARGTTTYSLAQCTTGGLIINQVFGADYLVVGGGGGGGGLSGGLLEGNTNLQTQTYWIVVENGGAKGRCRTATGGMT